MGKFRKHISKQPHGKDVTRASAILQSNSDTYMNTLFQLLSLIFNYYHWYSIIIINKSIDDKLTKHQIKILIIGID